jgi:hypothetical protein
MPALEGEARWKILPDSANRMDGRVDLIGQFGRNEWVTAYLATVLHSSGERTASLSVESPDPFTVWINGKERLRSERGDTAVVNPVQITLKDGANTVLLKTCQGNANWYLFFRLTDTGGQPLAGIRSEPEDLGGPQ